MDRVHPVRLVVWEHQRMRLRATTLITSAALVLILSGCGGGEEIDDVAVSGDPQTTTTEADGGDDATTTTSSDDGDASGADGGTGEPDPADGDQIVLADVSIGREGDVERVVFEFEGPELPDHEVRWVEGPIYTAGEGAEVEIAGDAVLKIAMSPAMPVRFDGENVEEVYTGGDRLEGAGGVIQEAVMFGAFESRLEWAIGLSREVPYEVLELSEPNRLVVELQTGS